MSVGLDEVHSGQVCQVQNDVINQSIYLIIAHLADVKWEVSSHHLQEFLATIKTDLGRLFFTETSIVLYAPFKFVLLKYHIRIIFGLKPRPYAIAHTL